MSNQKKKKPVDATANRPRGHQLPARASTELWTLLKQIAREDRRSVAQTTILLIEEALRARGRWNPSPDEETPP